MNTVKTKLFLSQVLGTIQVNLGPFRLGILGLLLWKQPFITFMLRRQKRLSFVPVPLRKHPCASLRLRGIAKAMSPRMWLPQSQFSPLHPHSAVFTVKDLWLHLLCHACYPPPPNLLGPS